MMWFRKILCLLLCLFLLPVFARAAETAESNGIIRDLIAYYFHYREEAAPEIENQLQILESMDPERGALWREVMGNWAWINEEMTVHTGVLPDGLPEDDSLCIVVLGFGLNGDGSMKPELLDRLNVALDSAEKYPRAYVLCTGGATSQRMGITEAGQMGNWLLKQGLSKDRLILETASLSTTENARNSMQILWRDYPQVNSLAIVSSDYHIRWGSAVFSAMCALQGGENRTDLVGNAGCTTDTPDRDSMYSQAWGICILADIPFDSSYVPSLYMTEEKAAPVVQADPVESAAELPVQQPEQPEPVIPVLIGLGTALILLFLPKKKKTDGSD